jgi:hypothetical protein
MKTDALLLYLTIAVIVLLIILFIVSYSNKSEGFGNFYDTQNKFTKEQGSYFNEKINRSIPTNLGLQGEMKKLQNTLFSVDTMLPKNLIPDNPPFNPEEDPMPGFRERNLRECANISRPKYLKPHTQRDPVSCGWWYMDDDKKQSIATLGTVNGPVDKAFTLANPGGEWVWDLAKAQQLEDAKDCRKIISCEVADLKPECGFCVDSFQGIPVEKGKAKYANDPNLSCANIVTDPTMCPPPEKTQVPKIVYAEDGTTLTSGDVYKGEVIPFEVVTPKGMCTPNPTNGQLSIECLVALAKAIGYSDQGIVIKVLTGDADGYYTRSGPNYDMYTITKRILNQKEKFNLRGHLLGDGPISKAEVVADYRRIFNWSKTKPIGLVKSACAWLVYGTVYDPCDYDPKERGPFDDMCLKRVALEVGCQRAGYKFPAPSINNMYNDMTWSMVNQFFADLFNKTADKTNSDAQRQATLDCLGITIAADAAILCGVKGAKCVVLTEAQIQQNTAVKAAQAQIDAFTSQSKGAQTPIEKAVADEMVAEAKQQKSKILAMIKRVNHCPPEPPYACWDFSLGRYDDRLGKYKSKKSGTIVYSTIGGKRAALFKGSSTCVKATGGFNTTQVKSVSMMVCVNSQVGPWPRLWELTNLPLGASWCGDSIFGCLGPDINMGVSMYAMKDCNGPSVWTNSTNAVKMQFGTWYHIAWAMDRDFSGMTIYINGIKCARWSDPNNAEALRNRNFKDFYICQSEEQFDKDVAINNVRLFDYTMDEAACRADMSNAWAFPAPPPVPLEPQPKSVYKGCFRDGGDRALPIRLNNVSKTEDCMEQALNVPNATEYGLQYYGECWVGVNAKYDRYGPMDEAVCETLGTAWNNKVYSLKAAPCDPSFSKDIEILPGKMIAKLKHNGDYNLSFNIKVTEIVGNWGSIIHFTNTGKDCCGFGDRGPSIWFYPGTTKLYIILGDSIAGGDWGLRETDFVVPLNQVCKFSLSCEGKDIRCSLDNDVYTTTQPGTRPAGDFLVFSSDPWYTPAKASLSQFCFSQTPQLVPPPPPKFIGPAMCMDLGKASGDRRIRIYDKAECDKLDGNWYANGECTKKAGGSFSWDCRELNNNDALNTYKGPAKCRDLGKNSDDDSIRIYTKDECDNLEGNWYANGECIKKGGGSWSWDCRELNTISGLGRTYLGPPICKDLGEPSDDDNIRIYTQAECNKMQGNWHANGECTKKEGGSWSWDCRDLNKITALNKFKGPKQCKGIGRPSPNGQIRLYEKTECDKLAGNWHGNGECTKPAGGSFSWDCRVLNSM